MRRKFIGLFELSIMILAVFSFAYLVSTDSVQIVSAQSEEFKGCCLETLDGAICQNIPMFQRDLCKSSLIGTGCEVVEQCQVGCCYSPNTGTCAMRAPKEKCLENGGNWTSDAACNIPQCQLGCCVMGGQATLTNSRECTLISNQFNFEKNFVPIGLGESCEQYVGLEKEGACLTDSGDFSGEKNCAFTTKKNCRGEFVEDYLCTSEELNSICEKTKKTSCVQGKDQVYFLDSCGNVANVYDASKVDDQSYWEKPIDPKESCAKEGVGCGNCNYFQGSICVEHEQGKTVKPTYGDYTCKSLHCGDRKHGESWCVYDFNPLSGVAPVGSRHFVASCFEGEISIEGCADFMQEICAQSTDTSFGFTEAKCLVNDWRSCLNANDASSYSAVKKKCDENPQCIMFNDFYKGNLKRSDNEFFAGFDPEKTNAEQGASGDLGKDQNQILAHCVPKFTPGFQFWTTSDSIVGSGKQQKSSANYGGSNEETSAICSLGSFSCVSMANRDTTLYGDSGTWRDQDNWECNFDARDKKEIVRSTDLPALLVAMNERCRALGSCGVSTNIVGEVNSDYPGFSVKRVHIDRKGKVNEKVNATDYVLSSGQTSSLKRNTFSLTNLNQLRSLGGGPLSAEDADTAGTTGSVSGGVIDLKEMAKGVDIGRFKGVNEIVTFGGGLLTSILVTKGFSGFPIAGWAIVGYFIGAQLGSMIAKNQGWSPGKQQQFTNFMGGVGAVTTLLIYTAAGGYTAATATTTATFSFASGLVGIGPIGWIILIAAIIYTIFTGFFDTYEEREYYIMEFTCESWQPPQRGDCSFCNDDVRPCSEYRCKSLGSNCHYFIENGEPGYCASINEIWSAQISPWQGILTSGNQYSNIQRNGFKITGHMGGGVAAWESLTFGIVTDKPATCKIDFEHTQEYEEMKYEMISPINPDTGKADGTHHKIELNAFGGPGAVSRTTIGLAQGEENEFYIRCVNFAGQVNEAEFVVQVRVRDGPDLTPPDLRRFEPATGSYLKQGSNSTEVVLYLNEPAECRFDYEYDVLSGEDYFEELRHEMFCLTSPQSALFGEWSCFANLENLTVGKNTLYFRCKDQPNLVEEGNYKRNANFVSDKYELNVCSNGLDINLLNSNAFIEEPNFTLSVATSGCVGDAVCSFRMENYSDMFNVFFSTGGKIHSQLLTLPQGDHKIDVFCEDEARNVANKTFEFTVYFDETPPKILRVINLDGKISLVTDEPAECMYETNKTIGCNFDFESNTPSYLSKEHSFNSNILETYFIRCRDEKLNLPMGCSITIRPVKTGK
jgi:hypothetical protein